MQGNIVRTIYRLQWKWFCSVILSVVFCFCIIWNDLASNALWPNRIHPLHGCISLQQIKNLEQFSLLCALLHRLLAIVCVLRIDSAQNFKTITKYMYTWNEKILEKRLCPKLKGDLRTYYIHFAEKFVCVKNKYPVLVRVHWSSSFMHREL